MPPFRHAIFFDISFLITPIAEPLLMTLRHITLSLRHLLMLIGFH